MKGLIKYSLAVLVVLLIGTNLYTINKYEKLIQDAKISVSDGFEVPKYTSAEIIAKIKALPDYQGDSITIYEDGVIASNVPEIQGGIQHTYLSNDVQLEALKKEAYYTKEPLGYLVYKHVIPYYISQYGNRKDSIR